MSYVRGGLGFVSAGVNPLDGQPLQPGQVLVTGPLATGPRVTVVWALQPSSWPQWISAGVGGPQDLGTVVGGTWDGTGAQSLPDLTTTGAPSWVWLVAAAVIYFLVFGERKTPGEWE